MREYHADRQQARSEQRAEPANWCPACGQVWGFLGCTNGGCLQVGPAVSRYAGAADGEGEAGGAGAVPPRDVEPAEAALGASERGDPGGDVREAGEKGGCCFVT